MLNRIINEDHNGLNKISKKNENPTKISIEHVSMSSTASSDIFNEGKRLSLRQKRNVNYNSRTKKFEYDDDSDYQDYTKKKDSKK